MLIKVRPTKTLNCVYGQCFRALYNKTSTSCSVHLNGMYLSCHIRCVGVIWLDRIARFV